MYLRRQEPVFPNFGSGANDNHGSAILAITGATTAFACVVVLARLYVRAVMLKTIGSDDWSMVVAMVCSAAVYACFIGEVKLGVGEHITNPQLDRNTETIQEWSFFHAWIVVVGISFVKISIGFFLLRLVQGKWLKRSIVAWIIFLFIFTLASMGTIIFQCLPISAAWDPILRLQPATRCYSDVTFRNIGLFNGAINIFTDFVFASLPIPVIIPLQINLRTKLSLIFILSLGYLACAASVVKEILLSNFFNNPDPFFNYSFQVWNDVELNTGILAACLPALRPLFTTVLETANTIKTNGLRRTILGTATRHRYELQDEDTKMGPLPARSMSRGKQGYGVEVSGGSRSIYDGRRDFGPMSKLEQSVAETDDSGSEETMFSEPMKGKGKHRSHMPPPQVERPRGILRTTEVMVSR
ncbi:hypothetical protein V8E51_001825 [Hyaloscypha variabilis]